ncbi:type II toxin-antitoxin system HipA family toxin [Thermodesulfobacteriota bacterium]
MVDRAETAYIDIWGMRVGAVLWDSNKELASFEFEPSFLGNNLDLAPLTMSIEEARRGNAIFEFPNLARKTYYGLPGMLADSLPDKYGNKIINAWLARQGRTPESFSPVERLCYTGKRGMGALEFTPVIGDGTSESVPVEVEELVKLAHKVIHERSQLNTGLGQREALIDIIRVGTSAGGARPKAVIAWNEKTDQVRSGQVRAPEGFTYWILKFDGVKDESLGDPAGYGRIEYAYHKMAEQCGIDMTECRLFEEGGRAHFMTKRFDRTDNGEKVHMQSLCALAHFDFNEAGSYSYEQAFQVMRQLRLPYTDAEQLFRRMVFNLVARNQDDHTKNINFLMDKTGKWRLSPAFDVIYAHNPSGKWTNKHQMSVNGKREGFTHNDLIAVANEMNIKNGSQIVDQIVDVVSQWKEFARQTGVENRQIEAISRTHRLLKR